MNDMDIQSLMSLILPPGDCDVRFYLRHVSRALALRSDADLSATLGLPPATIANWKRRKKIPVDHEEWFRTNLVEKIVTYNVRIPDVEAEARAAVVRLIAENNGNPLKAHSQPYLATAHALGGLLALSQFLLDRMFDICRDECEISMDRITALLNCAMMFARHGDQVRRFVYGVPKGSQ